MCRTQAKRLYWEKEACLDVASGGLLPVTRLGGASESVRLDLEAGAGAGDADFFNADDEAVRDNHGFTFGVSCLFTRANWSAPCFLLIALAGVGIGVRTRTIVPRSRRGVFI